MTLCGRLFGLLPVVGLYACMVSQPMEEPVPKLGSTVTADLTDAGSAGMARWVGPGVTEIRGKVVTASEEALLLSVVEVRTRAGNETSWKGEQVDIPNNWIRSLQSEKFSPTRTALVAVVAGAAAYLAYTLADGISSGNPPPNPGGVTPE